ncbi:cutinase family protein [Nocardia sp. BMG51109]|uniref:cutinase family protein n=1 Tax=Nocardia sp. BMG51109 TaxID=1056816 RepID=UPI000464B8ED|nr:cutinase family protein [Nocardia sp. BMG51109]
MGNRNVLLSGKWRTAWVFAALLMVIGVLYPAAPAQAQWCAEVDVVVARGTGEPGYLGTEVGDPLFGALLDRSPVGLSGYPVNYPADLTDVFSVGKGSADLVAHLANQAAACPDQRFVLAGYSQGAAVVHTALGTGITQGIPGAVRMDGDLGGRVSSVLLFGDPMRLIGWNVPDPYLGRTANYCAAGDPICGAGIDFGAHTTYDTFVGAAADFAVERM